MADILRPAAGKDVAVPGSTPADATSKPIIVGHSAPVADAMVTPAAPPAGESAAVATPEVIKPLAPGSMRAKLAPSAEAAAAQIAADKVDDATEQVEDADAKAEEGYETRVQDILESGEYHVSIGQKAAKSSAVTFILTMLAIVLVGVATLFILTDLKVIDLGIKLPFHIFKQ